MLAIKFVQGPDLMKSDKILKKIAVIALATATSWSPSFAQQAKGGLYSYHTRPSGGCPGLDWHIVTEANGSLMGFVAWDQMKHMARLAGTMNKDRTFKMDAQEVGGTGRKATVSGTAAGDYITASIDGSGTACDKQVLQIPRDVGGLEGGGG
jgi:hypothetical protein